jgi:low affinity Fe/Cu permease
VLIARSFAYILEPQIKLKGEDLNEFIGIEHLSADKISAYYPSQ